MRDGDADVKVQMLCAIAGEADVVNSQPAFGYARGQIVDVAPALAAAWIASRTAQTVASDAFTHAAAVVHTHVLRKSVEVMSQ